MASRSPANNNPPGRPLFHLSLVLLIFGSTGSSFLNFCLVFFYYPPFSFLYSFFSGWFPPRNKPEEIIIQPFGNPRAGMMPRVATDISREAAGSNPRFVAAVVTRWRHAGLSIPIISTSFKLDSFFHQITGRLCVGSVMNTIRLQWLPLDAVSWKHPPPGFRQASALSCAPRFHNYSTFPINMNQLLNIMVHFILLLLLLLIFPSLL